MDPFRGAPTATLAGIDIVLTDVDDTLTRNGRLDGRTLDALGGLQRMGIRVVPATAASAGWASLMIHMWPVDGVIAENGGLYFCRDAEGRVARRYPDDRVRGTDLAALRQSLQAHHPFLEPADDQAYRETCLAFRRPASPERTASVLASLAELGGGGTVNSLWLLAWPGQRDKLGMAGRMLADMFGLDIGGWRQRILYVGDSENDEPMFAYFPHTVGVATVTNHPLTHWPRWVTEGPGGAGFVEVADRLIAARRHSPLWQLTAYVMI